MVINDSLQIVCSLFDMPKFKYKFYAINKLFFILKSVVLSQYLLIDYNNLEESHFYQLLML